jgi:benzil reductase ((S)-benzoin forming)
MILASQLASICQSRFIPLTVLHIGSGASKHPIPHWSAYCTTKAAAAMFFACLAVENPGWKIVDMDPGVLDTDMQSAIRKSAVGPSVDKAALKDPDVAAREILARLL